MFLQQKKKISNLPFLLLGSDARVTLFGINDLIRLCYCDKKTRIFSAINKRDNHLSGKKFFTLLFKIRSWIFFKSKKILLEPFFNGAYTNNRRPNFISLSCLSVRSFELDHSLKGSARLVNGLIMVQNFKVWMGMMVSTPNIIHWLAGSP